MNTEKFNPARRRITLTPGQSIRLAREANEMTQTELAAATGLMQSTISALENDKATLGAERAKVLARALHVHPAVLLFPDWESQAA